MFVCLLCLNTNIYANTESTQQQIGFINSVLGLYRLNSVAYNHADAPPNTLSLNNTYIRIIVVQRYKESRPTEEKELLNLTPDNFNEGELIVEKVFVDTEENEVKTQYLLNINLSDIANDLIYKFPEIPETPYVQGTNYYSNIDTFANKYLIDLFSATITSLMVTASVDNKGPYHKLERAKTLFFDGNRIVFSDSIDDFARRRGFVNRLMGRDPLEWERVNTKKGNIKSSIYVMLGTRLDGMSTRLRHIGELHGILAVDRLDHFLNLTGTNNKQCFEFLND